jgi:hypothetical protein
MANDGVVAAVAHTERVWTLLDPNDPTSHPKEDRIIEMLFSNGQSYEGRYAHSIGFFCHLYLKPENTELLKKCWRYIE